MSSSFSLRNLPSCEEEVVLRNEWVPITYKFPLRADFEKALKLTKAISKELVGGKWLIPARNFADILNRLPFGLATKGYEFCTNAIAMAYSNMPGPKDGFIIDKTKIH